MQINNEIRKTLTVLSSQLEELDRQLERIVVENTSNGDVSEAEKRSEAARKAHRTRKANAERERRSAIAHKAVRTRRRNAKNKA